MLVFAMAGFDQLLQFRHLRGQLLARLVMYPGIVAKDLLQSDKEDEINV